MPWKRPPPSKTQGPLQESIPRHATWVAGQADEGESWDGYIWVGKWTAEGAHSPWGGIWQQGTGEQTTWRDCQQQKSCRRIGK